MPLYSPDVPLELRIRSNGLRRPPMPYYGLCSGSLTGEMSHRDPGIAAGDRELSTIDLPGLARVAASHSRPLLNGGPKLVA